jgi:hypothetical protein
MAEVLATAPLSIGKRLEFEDDPPAVGKSLKKVHAGRPKAA